MDYGHFSYNATNLKKKHTAPKSEVWTSVCFSFQFLYAAEVF